MIFLFLLLVYPLFCFDCQTSFYKGHKYGNFGGTDLCKNDYFYLSYSSDMINPDYAAFYLTYENMINLKGGRRSFLNDPVLQKMSIVQANPSSKAFSNIINRGHLTPSHAMSWNKTIDGPWYCCYMMSNIAPQNAKLNQIKWSQLETNEINFILNNKLNLYVITGVGYYDRNNPTRLTDNIAYPDYFYNAICDDKNKQSVAFIARNDNIHTNDTLILRSVSYLEDYIGNKLFDDCNNDKIDINHWWLDIISNM